MTQQSHRVQGLNNDEVAARGFESIKPEEADLVFDPFQLNFESGKAL